MDPDVSVVPESGFLQANASIELHGTDVRDKTFKIMLKKADNGICKEHLFRHPNVAVACRFLQNDDHFRSIGI